MHARTMALVLVLLLSAIRAVSVAESQVPAPAAEPSTPVTWPSWSPDGQWLAVQSYVPPLRGRGTTVLLVRADGLEAKWPVRRFGVRQPGWSPDGRVLLLHSDDAIFVYDLTSGRMQRAAHERPTWHASWSPDSRHISFTMNRDGSIRVYTADVTPEAARWVAVRQVLTEGDTEAMCTAWSPDGRQIAYGKLRRDLDFAEIRVISLSDGSDRMIWRLPASRDVARLTWSPDGRQLYCSMDPYGRANLVTLTRRVPVGIPSFDEYSYQLNDLFGRFDFRIPADVVEAWERRVGGFYVPNRADGGYAVYRHVFDVPVPERFAVVDCLPTAGDEVAKPLVMPGVDAPVQVAVSRDGTKMAIVNEELSDDGAILTPRVLVCDADGSNQRPLEIRPVGIERPFTVVPVEPDFPITHGCLLKAIQRYAVQVFPEEGWPTVESVRFIFRQVGGRERQVVAEYDVTKPVVALLDPAGEAKATVSPGSPEVARTDGAALAGELCWVETRGESGQVQVGLGIEGDGDVGEWEFTVQVRGHGQESESPILGWVKLYPTTSRAQAASERLMRRQER